MHYIITDIHNDSWRFMKLLEKIDLTADDHLYLLGDLFDRCMDHPDPAGVYFQVLKLGKKCTVIRGNHDHWLANYIFRYYGMDERDRVLLQSYPYNSFHLLQERLTEDAAVAPLQKARGGRLMKRLFLQIFSFFHR